MGRTFEVLGGRMRKPAGAAPAPALPFPPPDADSPPGPELVPVAADDLPSDDDSVPHIEVGGPRAKNTAPPGPNLLPPRPPVEAPAREVGFQLWAPDAMAAAAGPLGDDLIVYHRPEHPVARQYRRLADGISAQHPGGRSPVILFTPMSFRAVGTATVPNLAITRAADGNGRVLVVEVERSAGSPAVRFGVPPVPGLRELLARTVPLGLALHRTAVDGLFLLPAGKASVGSEEAARLPALLDQFRARFDWVLVDAPAWGTYPLADWARASDGVYLVMPKDEWDSPQADAVHDGIARAGGRLRGCVTTDPVTTPRETESEPQTMVPVATPEVLGRHDVSSPVPRPHLFRVPRRPGDG
jgi:Mrp family chromosome partitioning ATPase